MDTGDLAIVLTMLSLLGGLFFALWGAWRAELDVLHEDRDSDMGFGKTGREKRLGELRSARRKGSALIFVAAIAVIVAWSAGWSIVLDIRPSKPFSLIRFVVVVFGCVWLFLLIFWSVVCLRRKLWKRVGRLKRAVNQA